METEIDYYEILGVERTADHIEIRRAYKKLALSHHPDKVPEDERPEAEQRFKSISEAYEVLSKEETRAHYDMFGTSAKPGSGNGSYSWQDQFDPQFGPEAFAEFFGFNQSQYHAHANGGGERANGHSHHTNGGFRGRTEDANIEIDIPLEDIYRGRVLKLSSSRQILCKACEGVGARPKAKPKTCGVCNGTGSTQKLRHLNGGLMTADTMPCDACHGRGQTFRTKDQCKRCTGTGTVEERSIFEVYIPRGAPDGYREVLKGKADEMYGYQTGNIVVTVQVAPHERFTREGQDLYTKANITLGESLLGFSRVLATQLDGRALRVTVPRGSVTKPNTVLKIAGEGMPKAGSDVRGDLYIVLEIDFPDRLDPSTVIALENALPVPPCDNNDSEVDDVDAVQISVDDLPTYDHEDENGEFEVPGGCATN